MLTAEVKNSSISCLSGTTEPSGGFFDFYIQKGFHRLVIFKIVFTTSQFSKTVLKERPASSGNAVESSRIAREKNRKRKRKRKEKKNSFEKPPFSSLIADLEIVPFIIRHHQNYKANNQGVMTYRSLYAI